MRAQLLAPILLIRRRFAKTCRHIITIIFAFYNIIELHLRRIPNVSRSASRISLMAAA